MISGSKAGSRLIPTRDRKSLEIGSFGFLFRHPLSNLLSTPAVTPSTEQCPAAVQQRRSLFDRLAVRNRLEAAHGEGRRRGSGRHRRPGHTADAEGPPGRAHGDPQAAVRRLLACHALVHASGTDGADRGDSRHRAGPTGSCAPEIQSRGLTLVGVSVANLADDATLQLALPLGRGDHDALDAAMDEVRERYGADAVKRAVLLGRDTGLSMPLLPD